MRKFNIKILSIVLFLVVNTFPLCVCATEPNDNDVLGIEETQEADGTQEIQNTSLANESKQQGYAETESSVNDARNGILQVNLVYIDDDDKTHLVRGGSGFLIGNDEGADYVITSNTNIEVTDDLRASVGKEFKVPKAERKNMQFGIQVVVKRDIVVEATVTTYSEQINFAVLKLSQTIYDRKPLQIEKNPEMTQEMETIFTLGFPEEIQNQQDVSFYTFEDVSVMNGIISKKVTLEGTLYIQHSATVTLGNAGGPTLNQYGQVIGVNQIIMEDGYNYSVHISEVTSALDALGIPYTEVVHEAIIEPVDTSVLEAAIKTAREKDLKGYTEESIIAYNDIINQAETILNSENITDDQVAKGLVLLSSANTSLVIKSNNYLFYIAGGIIFALVILVVFLIIFVVKKPKKADSEEIPKKESKKNKNSYEELVASPPFQPVPKNAETSVLNSAMGFDEGETTILEEPIQSGATLAVLRRLKNNETIEIQKAVFYMGKDGLKVDYCIKGNPAISRSHAVIKQIDKEFYLEDLHATNGTFHNDIRLGASQSVKLVSGDRIKLANEEFVITI